jgi:hypothetical protein
MRLTWSKLQCHCRDFEILYLVGVTTIAIASHNLKPCMTLCMYVCLFFQLTRSTFSFLRSSNRLSDDIIQSYKICHFHFQIFFRRALGARPSLGLCQQRPAKGWKKKLDKNIIKWWFWYWEDDSDFRTCSSCFIDEIGTWLCCKINLLLLSTTKYSFSFHRKCLLHVFLWPTKVHGSVFWDHICLQNVHYG